MSNPTAGAHPLRSRDTATAVGIVPLVVGLVVAVGGVIAIPDLADNDRHNDYAQLFATVAQVIATLLVALALEARAFPFTTVFSSSKTAGATLAWVAVGQTAAIAAHSPALSNPVYALSFGAAVGGASTALLLVLVLAHQILQTDFQAKNELAFERLAEQIGEYVNPAEPAKKREPG